MPLLPILPKRRLKVVRPRKSICPNLFLQHSVAKAVSCDSHGLVLWFVLAVFTPGFYMIFICWAAFRSPTQHQRRCQASRGVLCGHQICKEDALLSWSSNWQTVSPCKCFQTLTTEPRHIVWHAEVGPSSTSIVNSKLLGVCATAEAIPSSIHHSKYVSMKMCPVLDLEVRLKLLLVLK